GEAYCLIPSPDNAKPKTAWKSNKLRANYGTPLFDGNRIYNVTSANVLVCLDAADARVLWQERVRGPISASLVAAEGKLYCLSEEGEPWVVRLGDKPEILAVNKLRGTFLATPAIADGAIFLRTDQHLWCIGAKK